MTGARSCLVVDDSRVVRQIVRRMLEGRGLDVQEAEDGARALQMCRTSPPGCVLLDWNMPVMNGIEFLQALRAEFGESAPVVVFCTTENGMEYIQQAISCGAQEYIMKPFDEDILFGKLEQAGFL